MGTLTPQQNGGFHDTGEGPDRRALHKLLTDFYATQVTEPLLYHSEQLASMIAANPDSVQVAPMMGHMVGGDVLVIDRAGNPVNFVGSVQVAPPVQAVQAVLAGQPYTGQLVVMNRGLSIVTATPIPNSGGAVIGSVQSHDEIGQLALRYSLEERQPTPVSSPALQEKDVIAYIAVIRQ